MLSCLRHLSLRSLPQAALAQSATTGTIAGVVKDTSGAVLPGVTVEAASPALIEKVRTAVTDDQGNYKIIELRPGTYTVTFTLPGFATLKREGIELTAGFTATVNAEMKVGALEETVTVTGASPVVDVQNVRTQTVLSREVLDALPTFKSLGGFIALTLSGANPRHPRRRRKQGRVRVCDEHPRLCVPAICVGRQMGWTGVAHSQRPDPHPSPEHGGDSRSRGRGGGSRRERNRRSAAQLHSSGRGQQAQRLRFLELYERESCSRRI